jgi:hypothetical protein
MTVMPPAVSLETVREWVTPGKVAVDSSWASVGAVWASPWGKTNRDMSVDMV